MFNIHLIYLSDLNGLIGLNGEQPYYIEEDLKRFYKFTKNNTVIMGRKTYESILKRLGHPLKNRNNIILTNDTKFNPLQGFTRASLVESRTVVATAHSLLGSLMLANEFKKPVYVIGGEDLYKQFESLASYIHHTKVDHYFDTESEPSKDLRYFIPDLSKFILIDQGTPKSFSFNDSTLFYEFLSYKRKLF